MATESEPHTGPPSMDVSKENVPTREYSPLASSLYGPPRTGQGLSLEVGLYRRPAPCAPAATDPPGAPRLGGVEPPGNPPARSPRAGSGGPRVAGRLQRQASRADQIGELLALIGAKDAVDAAERVEDRALETLGSRDP